MTEIKNLLPVGSVVKLKGVDKDLAIMGIMINSNGKHFDYVAVPSPEGYVDANTVCMFNHEDIESVEYLGFMDLEFQLFRGTADTLSKSGK